MSSVWILQDPFSCHVSSDLFNLRLFLHLSLYFTTLKLSVRPSILFIRIFPMINSVYSFLARIPPKGFFSLLSASYQKTPFTNVSSLLMWWLPKFYTNFSSLKLIDILWKDTLRKCKSVSHNTFVYWFSYPLWFLPATTVTVVRFYSIFFPAFLPFFFLMCFFLLSPSFFLFFSPFLPLSFPHFCSDSPRLVIGSSFKLALIYFFRWFFF